VASPRQDREALAALIDPVTFDAEYAERVIPDDIREAREEWALMAAERVLAAGYVTPETHAAVVADRDNLSLSFCNAVTRCEGAEATLSERTFERDNAVRTAQEMAQAVVDAHAAPAASQPQGGE
jgi:hypothetical protein